MTNITRNIAAAELERGMILRDPLWEENKVTSVRKVGSRIRVTAKDRVAIIDRNEIVTVID